MNNYNVRMTVPEAGKILGLSAGAAYRAARNEQLPGCVRIGRKFIVIRPVFFKSLGIDENSPSEPAADVSREVA